MPQQSTGRELIDQSSEVPPEDFPPPEEVSVLEDDGTSNACEVGKVFIEVATRVAGGGCRLAGCWVARRLVVNGG